MHLHFDNRFSHRTLKRFHLDRYLPRYLLILKRYHHATVFHGHQSSEALIESHLKLIIDAGYVISIKHGAAYEKLIANNEMILVAKGTRR